MERVLCKHVKVMDGPNSFNFYVIPIAICKFMN